VTVPRLLGRAASSLVVDRLARSRRLVGWFVPAAGLDEALDLAAREAARGIGSTLTYLGEVVHEVADGERVVRHHLDALDGIRRRRLPCELSVKLSHLGLGLPPGTCESLLAGVCARAESDGRMVWIDMEGSGRTDRALAVHRSVSDRHPNLGLSVQASLRRTPADLDALVARGAAVRLVKGGFREPPAIALRRRRDVRGAYLHLGRRLLAEDARRAGVRAVFATHDTGLLARLAAHAGSLGLGPEAFECHMLYGFRRRAQRRLRGAGVPVRVLVSYGEARLAWYAERLAARPAGLWTVLRGIAG
jgi:proline dehydrogenase